MYVSPPLPPSLLLSLPPIHTHPARSCLQLVGGLPGGVEQQGGGREGVWEQLPDRSQLLNHFLMVYSGRRQCHKMCASPALRLVHNMTQGLALRCVEQFYCKHAATQCNARIDQNPILAYALVSRHNLAFVIL